MPSPDEIVELVDADGHVAYRKAADVDKAIALGMRLRTPADRVAADVEAAREQHFTSLEQQARAVTRGAVRGASLGLSAVLDRATKPDAMLDEERLADSYNRGKVAAAEIAGAAVPSLVAGGAGALGAAARATPAGAVSALGSGLAAAGEGASFAARAGRAALGFGVEGAIQGAGQELGQLATAEDPLTLERVASALPSAALLGGLSGAVLGAGGVAVAQGGRSLAKGLAKSREVVDDAAKGVGAGEDFTGLDRKALRIKRAEHVDELAAQQAQDIAARKAAVVDEVAQQRRAVADSGVWTLVDDAKQRARLNASEKVIDRLLDTPMALKESPGALLKPLEKGLHVLEETVAKSDEIAKRLAAEQTVLARELGEELATLPDAASRVRLTGKLATRYGDFINKAIGKKAAAEGVEIAVDQAADFLRAMETGEVMGARQAALKQAPELLQQRRALYQRVKAALEPGKARGELFSPRMAAIDSAIDAAGEVRKAGLVEQMMQGTLYGSTVAALPSMPIVGPVLAPLVGAKVSKAVTGLFFGRGARAVADSAARTARAVEAVATVGKRVAPAAPPLASRVLGSVAFAPPPKRQLPVGDAKATSGSLLEVYRKREGELISQVGLDMTGRVTVTPAARAKIAERLRPIHVASPVLADRLETMAVRRLEFLAAKLPKRPDYAALTPGPDRWRPSDMEMRKFARYVAAVEDPGAVEERVADGTITPEDAEAYRAVYPERFEDFRRQVVEKLSSLRQTLPYERRVALSIFTGVPVDPAMRPETIRRLQAQFSVEPGTGGGTQAPTAMPQGGSISRERNEDMTPAQRRAAE